MPRLRHRMVAPEVADTEKEELSKLVRRCARLTDGCDSHGMAFRRIVLLTSLAVPSEEAVEMAGTNDGSRRQRLLHANCGTTANGTGRTFLTLLLSDTSRTFTIKLL